MVSREDTVQINEKMNWAVGSCGQLSCNVCFFSGQAMHFQNLHEAELGNGQMVIVDLNIGETARD